MLKKVKGRSLLEWHPKTASTALSFGALMASTSGYLTAATTSTLLHLGVLLKPVAATDSDYASATSVPVEVPLEDSEWEIDIGSGTYSAALNNTQCDLADSLTAAVQTNSHHQLTILRAGSTSSKVIVKINSARQYSNGS